MTTTRLEAFSDGVFAIAITLLVIAIAVPAVGPDLAARLLALWPSYLAYALSFIVVGAIWINHHAMFQHVARADNSFLLLNILQLMMIAFIPFPTAVLAQSIHAGAGLPAATAFYGLTLVAVGLSVTAMWWYAARHGLLRDHLSPAQVRSIGRRYLVGPVVYAIAVLIGLALPWLALAIFVGLNLFYLWPRSVKKASGPH